MGSFSAEHEGIDPMDSKRSPTVENTLLAMFCLVTTGSALVVLFHGPVWAANALIGLAFLLAAPFSFLVIRRKLRKSE